MVGCSLLIGDGLMSSLPLKVNATLQCCLKSGDCSDEKEDYLLLEEGGMIR